MNKYVTLALLLCCNLALGQGTQIQALPPVITPAGTDIFPIAQIGTAGLYTPPATCQGGYCGVGETLAQIRTFIGAGVSATGSPTSGELVSWSGANSVTNGNLFGDCATVNTLAILCTKTNGVNFAASATTDTTNASNISSGTLPNARLNSTITSNTSGIAAAANALTGSPTQCSGGQFSTGINTAGNANCSTPAGSGNVSTSGVITTGSLAGWASSTTIQTVNLSGDCTTSSALAVTCTKTSGVAFGTFATASASAPPSIGNVTPAAGAFSTLTVNAINVGYLGFPVVGSAPRTAGGTMVLADQGFQYQYNCSGSCTHTIPANSGVAFPIGSWMEIDNLCTAAGTLTIAITTDTLYLSPTAATGSRTLPPCGEVIIKKETATTWKVMGTGVS